MVLRNAKVLATAALMTGLSGVAVAEPAPADTAAEIQALRHELRQTQAQLNGLRPQGQTATLSQQQSQEVRALVREVLADADTRASLLQEGLTAGWDGEHFYLASDEQDFLMQFTGLVQFRYIANFGDDFNFRDDETDLFDDSDEFGFEMRRTRVGLQGYLAGGQGDWAPGRISYEIELDTDRDSLDVFLLDAKFGVDVTDNTTVEFGQQKLPFTKQKLINAGRQLAVERSLVNQIFAVNRSQGIWVRSDVMDNVRVAAAFSDGESGGEVGGFGGAGFGSNSDFAITGRADIRLLGDNWEQADDIVAWQGEGQAAYFGLAAHYQGDTDSTVGRADVDHLFTWTGDVHYENMGFSLLGSGYSRHMSFENEGSDFYGAMVEGGYLLVPDKLQPFLRYEWAGGDHVQDIHMITGGINWFLKQHNLKFTTDVVWAVDGVDQGWGTFTNKGGLGLGGFGLLGSPGGGDDQIAARAQFQVGF